jgi:CheY-like chemotaxis protein
VDKISTIEDMYALADELSRLQGKLLTDFYGVAQDFSTKKFFPNWLQKKGITALTMFEKGKPVLEKILSTTRLNAVLYDLETPDQNGLEFLNAVRGNPEVRARTKVIIMSQRLSPDAREKLSHFGANALVEKPLDANRLQEAFVKIGLKI